MSTSSARRDWSAGPRSQERVDDGCAILSVSNFTALTALLQFKDVGLGFRTPENAKTGTYIDKAWLDGKREHWAIADIGLEMSFRRNGLHSRPYPHRHRRLHKDAPNDHHPPRIPSLHPQVQPLREEAQEPCGALLARFPCRARRYVCCSRTPV